MSFCRAVRSIFYSRSERVQSLEISSRLRQSIVVPLSIQLLQVTPAKPVSWGMFSRKRSQFGIELCWQCPQGTESRIWTKRVGIEGWWSSIVIVGRMWANLQWDCGSFTSEHSWYKRENSQGTPVVRGTMVPHTTSIFHNCWGVETYRHDKPTITLIDS